MSLQRKLCDPVIFKHGELFTVLALGTDDARMKYREFNAMNDGYRYDWHYVGGRAVFKRMKVNEWRKTSDGL